MTLLRAAALAAFAAAALSASAQQPGAFKGKVRPGLYEAKIEVDMGNMPGVPADARKQTTTRQQCLTDAEIDKLAEESNATCKTTDFRMTGAGASFRVTCAGPPPMTSEVKITFTPGGYVTDSKATLRPPGSSDAVVVTQRSTNKYFGPCPKK